LIIALFLPLSVNASWLSDITGINIDVPNGSVSFGPPRPDRIPLMLQNLPKDATQFFLNPAGNALAFFIRQAKGLARQDCQAVPQDIQMTLGSFFPRDVFNGVCWNVYGQRFAIDSLLLQDFNQGAVTLEDVIVFRDYNAASNPVLWAHELTHVLQYRRLGLETFAHLYTFSSGSLEGEAYGFQNFVQSRLQMPPQQYWTVAPGWNPQAQISTAQYVAAAQQFIDPFSCSHFEVGPGIVRLINQCPIPIRATGFAMINTLNGVRFVIPCITPICTVNPGMVSQWPEPPAARTENISIVW
jgi:hypothetical protein